MVANIDIAPTLLAAAGVAAPRSFDGRDALPLARGETARPGPGERLCCTSISGNATIPRPPRCTPFWSGRWKYIRYHGIWDTDELFDLEADPTESTNLIARPEHQETVARLHRTLFDLLDETRGSEHSPALRIEGRRFPGASRADLTPGTFPERFFVPKDPSQVPPWARGIEGDGTP